ncbi:hypothetical protein OBV_p-00340 (plasmid) [Oscillibacter valericigenes Sjm18-20]|nr:hypothetical protein OBV_p-00340 [Oscillibacter valericigenes Sjm18-20]
MQLPNPLCKLKNTNNEKKVEVLQMKNTDMIAINNTGSVENGKLEKMGNFLNRHSNAIICIAMLSIMFMGIASASSAESLWTTVAGLIKTWVTRLGGVVMFVGGIMFGLGWKSDDAEQKSRGIQTLIAGAIVGGVAALTGTFFA